MILNYRKLDGSDNQVTGTLYSIGNNYYRGLRFFQKPSTSTTFIQLHMNECCCNNCDCNNCDYNNHDNTKVGWVDPSDW